jgi:hypothetical protein
MPGATPIYGFPYPDPSDLVANYPALGQDLAEDIEAVLPTLGGLTLITSASFSAASAVSVNDCFTTTYANYRILFRAVTASGGQSIQFRLRVGGSDNSTANSYIRQFLIGASASALAGTGANDFAHVLYANTTSGFGSVEVNGPFPAAPTFFYSTGAMSDGAILSGGNHNQSTSYTGFTMYPSASTFTGTILVFAYRN